MARKLNALQQLTQDHMERTGETMSDIAVRGGLARQTVSALMGRPEYASTPHRGTLDKLAKGLNLSRATVREAAVMSVSMGPGRTRATPKATVLADLVTHLSDAEVAVLVATAQAMVSVRNGVDVTGRRTATR